MMGEKIPFIGGKGATIEIGRKWIRAVLYLFVDSVIMGTGILEIMEGKGRTEIYFSEKEYHTCRLEWLTFGLVLDIIVLL